MNSFQTGGVFQCTLLISIIQLCCTETNSSRRMGGVSTTTSFVASIVIPIGMMLLIIVLMTICHLKNRFGRSRTGVHPVGSNFTHSNHSYESAPPAYDKIPPYNQPPPYEPPPPYRPASAAIIT